MVHKFYHHFHEIDKIYNLNLFLKKFKFKNKFVAWALRYFSVYNLQADLWFKPISINLWWIWFLLSRRIIWTFSIAYGDDFEKAKNLLLKWIKNDKRILKDKEPLVVLSELADSSVNIMVRVWVKSEDFLEVKFDYNEKVYSRCQNFT